MNSDLTINTSANSNAASIAEEENELTGLPGLRDWPRVYILVVLNFILQVVLLVMLAKVFS